MEPGCGTMSSTLIDLEHEARSEKVALILNFFHDRSRKDRFEFSLFHR